MQRMSPSSTRKQSPVVGVVGDGVSGTVTVATLLIRKLAHIADPEHYADSPDKNIVWMGRNAREDFGAGYPYGSEMSDTDLLNVAADYMDLYGHIPGIEAVDPNREIFKGFHTWCVEHAEEQANNRNIIDPSERQEFIKKMHDPQAMHPRTLFGAYMKDQSKLLMHVAEACHKQQYGIKLKVCDHCEVQEPHQTQKGWHVTANKLDANLQPTGEQQEFTVSDLVLATGHWKTETPKQFKAAEAANAYFPAYPVSQYRDVLANGNTVILQGAALSAVDVLRGIVQGIGHMKPVYAVRPMQDPEGHFLRDPENEGGNLKIPDPANGEKEDVVGIIGYELVLNEGVTLEQLQGAITMVARSNGLPHVLPPTRENHYENTIYTPDAINQLIARRKAGEEFNFPLEIANLLLREIQQAYSISAEEAETMMQTYQNNTTQQPDALAASAPEGVDVTAAYTDLSPEAKVKLEQSWRALQKELGNEPYVTLDAVLDTSSNLDRFALETDAEKLGYLFDLQNQYEVARAFLLQSHPEITNAGVQKALFDASIASALAGNGQHFNGSSAFFDIITQMRQPLNNASDYFTEAETKVANSQKGWFAGIIQAMPLESGLFLKALMDAGILSMQTLGRGYEQEVKVQEGQATFTYKTQAGDVITGNVMIDATGQNTNLDTLPTGPLAYSIKNNIISSGSNGLVVCPETARLGRKADDDVAKGASFLPNLYVVGPVAPRPLSQSAGNSYTLANRAADAVDAHALEHGHVCRRHPDARMLQNVLREQLKHLLQGTEAAVA